MVKSKYLQIAAYVLIAAIFIFIMGVAHNCRRLPSEYQEGNSGIDTIDIALLYGPGSYYLYDDTLGGINNDIALNFSAATGKPVKIWPVNEPASTLAKLEKGIFDVVASLPLDNNLKNKFPVSESVFFDRLVLLQVQDTLTGKTLINSSLDLNGKDIYIPSGSSAYQRISNLSEEIGGKINIIELPDLSEELICMKIATGELPLAIVNERIARKMAENYPQLHYDSSVSFTQFQVWVFNPSDTSDFNGFNKWFDSYRTSEAYRNLINKY